MSNRLIAIGDIHGCSIALKAMLTAIDPQPSDTIVALGDYIDRGPDTRGVLELLIDLQQRTNLIPLLGNHEEMMLQVMRGEQPYQEWLRFGGLETLESYGFDGDMEFLPSDHKTFLDSLRGYYVQDKYFFTHAAYDPMLPFEKQPADLLRWHSLRDGIPDPHLSGATAIVGHTANHTGEVLDVGHLICIDTYCYGGGCLTALDVNERAIWQVNNDGMLL